MTVVETWKLLEWISDLFFFYLEKRPKNRAARSDELDDQQIFRPSRNQIHKLEYIYINIQNSAVFCHIWGREACWLIDGCRAGSRAKWTLSPASQPLLYITDMHTFYIHIGICTSFLLYRQCLHVYSSIRQLRYRCARVWSDLGYLICVTIRLDRI